MLQPPTRMGQAPRKRTRTISGLSTTEDSLGEAFNMLILGSIIERCVH